MTELFLVRHGQASFGAENYDKLSASGVQQSVWLGEYFLQRQMCFSQLWRGNLIRHAETAEGILTALNKDVPQVINAGLNEFDFHDVGRAYLRAFPTEGLADNSVPKDYYRLLKKSMLAWSQGQLAPEHLKESWDEFKHRVHTVLKTIMASSDENPVLVVSSGGVIAMVVSIVLGLSADQIIELNLQIRNSSLTQFYFNQHHIRLSSFNTITHLDTPERFSAITFS